MSQQRQEKSELNKVFAEKGQVEAKVIKPIERPEIVTEEHLTYLDELRESGETNMLGARPYLQREFGLAKDDANDILMYWMDSFAERHPVKDGQKA